MSEAQVPEEILREILEYTLWLYPIDHWLAESAQLPDAELGGPISRDMRPTSSVLTVSKRWLRVATPIFYRYVLLSTQEQVQCLADVLRKNPDIGCVVRHIRLEGEYGQVLGKVLKHMPNVETVSVNMYAPSNGETAGLIRGLSLINPIRLYLHGDQMQRGGPENKPMQVIREATYQCVRHWEHLVSRVTVIPHCACSMSHA